MSERSAAVLQVGCISIVIVAGLLSGKLYHALDAAGNVPHNEESLITAQENWLVGESKDCSSVPLDAPAEGKERGYALSYVSCDDGPVRQMKIRFWGREEQPESALVRWRCTREDGGFTCTEVSAAPK
jgi:hypothetical protein